MRYRKDGLQDSPSAGIASRGRAVREAVSKRAPDRGRSNVSEIVVEDVRAEGGCVSYDYECLPDLRRFVAEDFAVEYDVDVSDVPESILVIPLLANLCPVAWAAGADVFVPRADETFLRALPKVARALEDFYPRLVRGGKIRTGEAVDNGATATEGKSGMLFSGGVDSTATYLRHREEEPTLVSVHGFDFTLDERETWSEREPFLREFAASRGLNSRFVRINMQSFLNLVMLNAHFGEHYDDNWITSVHHGLSLLGTCAPLRLRRGSTSCTSPRPSRRTSRIGGVRIRRSTTRSRGRTPRSNTTPTT